MGAADDVKRLTRAHIDGRQMEPIGVRVLLDGQQLADDDGPPVGAPALDAFHFHPQKGQSLGELFGRQLDVDVLA